MSHVNEQRLALSRGLIVAALRELTWIMVMQRWLMWRVQRPRSDPIEHHALKVPNATRSCCPRCRSQGQWTRRGQ